MKHLLEILRKEERNLRRSEEALKQKHDPKFDSQIAELDDADYQLQGAISTYKVSHLLREEAIEGAVAEGLKEYNRGLFVVKHTLDDTSINALMNICTQKNYNKIDLIGHYDGVIFNPTDKQAWEAIRTIKKGEKVAIYARNKDFLKTKCAIDFIGAFIGGDIEIPLYLETETQGSYVERMAFKPYRLSITFPEGLQLTVDQIANMAYSSQHPIYNSAENHGSVHLLAHYTDERTDDFDTKSQSAMSLLDGKTVSELIFTFQGGIPKEAAYSVLRDLDVVKEDKTKLDLSTLNKAMGIKTKKDKKEPSPQPKYST